MEAEKLSFVLLLAYLVACEGSVLFSKSAF
jgi:hypothetical protein